MPKIGIDIGYYNPRKIVPISFTDGSGSGGVTVLQDWYDSLSVKPSAGLWTDLKILADGMDADGDWTEADLISVHAGLETTEQRLKPFKTTSGNDIVKVLNGADSLEGLYAAVADNSIVSLSWTPSINGVKFTQNSAFLGHYVYTPATGNEINSGGAKDDFSKASLIYSVNQTLTSAELNYGFLNQVTSGGSIVSKTDFSSNAIKNLFVSMKRINGTNQTNQINDTFLNFASVSNSLLDKSFTCIGLLDDAQTGLSPLIVSIPTSIRSRAMIAGSGLIDHNRVATRLNTFFSARGLSIANY